MTATVTRWVLFSLVTGRIRRDADVAEQGILVDGVREEDVGRLG